jgi:hypothetical protein
MSLGMIAELRRLGNEGPGLRRDQAEKPGCRWYPEKRSAGGGHRPGYGFRRPGVAPCGLVPMRARRYGVMEGRCLYAPALEDSG